MHCPPPYLKQIVDSIHQNALTMCRLAPPGDGLVHVVEGLLQGTSQLGHPIAPSVNFGTPKAASGAEPNREAAQTQQMAASRGAQDQPKEPRHETTHHEAIRVRSLR